MNWEKFSFEEKVYLIIALIVSILGILDIGNFLPTKIFGLSFEWGTLSIIILCLLILYFLIKEKTK